MYCLNTTLDGEACLTLRALSLRAAKPFLKTPSIEICIPSGLDLEGQKRVKV